MKEKKITLDDLTEFIDLYNSVNTDAQYFVTLLLKGDSHIKYIYNKYFESDIESLFDVMEIESNPKIKRVINDLIELCFDDRKNHLEKDLNWL